MKRLIGVIALLMGLSLFAWLGYNLFIEMQPEAEGRSPIPAALLASAFIFVGAKLTLPKRAAKSES